jgi:hypothetical protein
VDRAIAVREIGRGRVTDAITLWATDMSQK